MTVRRKKVALALVALVCVLVLGTRWFTRRIVYQPWPDRGTPCPKGVEDVFFDAPDGTRLHGWLLRVPNATRAVLIAHGNAGNLEIRADTLLAVARATSAHTFLFDYRGYGRSEGSPTEAGVSLDARAALGALEGATKVPPSRTIVLGESLGGAVAVDLASRVPVAGLVVLSSFTSVNDVVRLATGLPLGFLVPETWDSASKIGKIACPKLFVHGDADDTIPFVLGVRLHELASEPKHFVRIQGGDHYPLAHALPDLTRFAETCAP